MSLLNLTSDGLPSVLFALIRALRELGPMPEEDLLALCCPATLAAHNASAPDRSFGRKTLTRWTQLGLFRTESGTVGLASGLDSLPTAGLEGVRAVGRVLRRLVFEHTAGDA